MSCLRQPSLRTQQYALAREGAAAAKWTFRARLLMGSRTTWPKQVVKDLSLREREFCV